MLDHQRPDRNARRYEAGVQGGRVDGPDDQFRPVPVLDQAI